MQLLSAVIVDDEPIILRRVKDLYESTGDVEVVATATTGEELLLILSKNTPDFLVMDINLPDIDGIMLAKEVRNTHPELPIIFLTGHAEFAVESYTVNATDYIMKPFEERRIIESIQKVKEKLNNAKASWDRIEKLLLSPGKVVIKQDSNLYFVDMKQILFLTKENKDTTLVTMEKIGDKWNKKCYRTRESMKEIQSRLDENFFVRTHNSFIVNIEWIHEVVRFSTEAYKIKFKHTKEYALLNRTKLNMIVNQIK